MDDPNLQCLLDQLVSDLKPEQVYLFGSRARGNFTSDSDYDLMVVLPDDAPRKNLSRINAWQLIKHMPMDADVVPIRTQAFSARKDWPGTLSYESAHHGIKLYERE